MRITIRYGTGNELTREFGGTPTLGSILADVSVRAALGFGANVEGRIDNVPQGTGTVLHDRDVITVHDRACAKAAF
jgi:hypothetical protein